MPDEKKPMKTATSEADKYEASAVNIEMIGIDSPEGKTSEPTFSRVGISASDTLARLNSLSASISSQSALAQAVEKMSSMQRTVDSALRGITHGSAFPTASEELAKANRFSNVMDNYRSDPFRADIKAATPPMPRIEIPPNPIHETNERLEKIEERFEQMHQLAHEAAGVANSLNTSVAELLVGFKGAAESNAKSAKIAMVIGVVAILISTASTAIPIIYDAVWVADREKIAEQESSQIFEKVVKENTETMNRVNQSLDNNTVSSRALAKKIDEVTSKAPLAKDDGIPIPKVK